MLSPGIKSSSSRQLLGGSSLPARVLRRPRKEFYLMRSSSWRSIWVHGLALRIILRLFTLTVSMLFNSSWNIVLSYINATCYFISKSWISSSRKSLALLVCIEWLFDLGLVEFLFICTFYGLFSMDGPIARNTYVLGPYVSW